MGDSGVTINIDCLPYLEQRFLKLFGQDYESRELAAWFTSLQKTAILQTASVQCVGMRRPVAFEDIYQPTRLRLGPETRNLASDESFTHQNKASRSILLAKSLEERSATVEEFLRRDDDAIIFAKPGWGKTTFLHHIYRSSIRNEDVLPVLITLRRPTAIEDLERYVIACSKVQKKQHRACTLLLVDGYDEISPTERRRVSEALLRYQAHRAGKFYLSCREYYDVAQLAAPQVRIAAFSRDDQVRFVTAFLSAFESRLNPSAVVDELESRGFIEFLSHPLLLTLACIVKTSSSSAQPRSALRLLERALDVLCYRWDEEKTIDRQRSTPLDGQDRRQILKRIAYRARSPFVQQHRAEVTARQELNLAGLDKVDARQALVETARFYGILVPTDDGYEFVHRTIHDFLAAQFWVESGDFAKVTRYEWNARTAYASCFMSDCTSILEKALESPDGLPTATEILSNVARFHKKQIAEAIIRYFSQPGRVRYHDDSDPTRVTGSLSTDFLRTANTRFLDFMIERCSGKRSEASDVIAAYCVIELYTRREKLEFQSYAAALAGYKSDRFTFNVLGDKQVQLGFLNPQRTNRLVSRAGNSARPVRDGE